VGAKGIEPKRPTNLLFYLWAKVLQTPEGNYSQMVQDVKEH
jgi:hypothetical protein